DALTALPADAASRAAELTGVVAAGTVTRLPGAGPVAAAIFDDPSIRAVRTLPVLAVSPGVFDAVRVEVVAGRTFDTGHADRADLVAVLGARAAKRLGVNAVDHQAAIIIGGRAFTVIGIVDGAVRHGELVDGVAVPEPTAAALFGWAGPSDLQVHAPPGPAALVAPPVRVAASPNDPDHFEEA